MYPELFLQRFVDFNLVKRLRFVSFWIVKRFVSNAQLSKSYPREKVREREKQEISQDFCL